MSCVCGRSNRSVVLGCTSLSPAPPHKGEPSLPSGRPTQDSLAISLPSLERSSAQGVSTVRRELSFSRSLFFPAVRCRLPPVGCLEVGHLRFSSVGPVGSPLAPTSGCAHSIPLSQGRAAQRPPEDPLRCAASRHRNAEEAKGTTQQMGLGRVEQELVPLLQGVGTRALPSRRPRVWSWRSHQFSL